MDKGNTADPRFYRVYQDLPDCAFRVVVETTDLYIRADGDFTGEALAAARSSRRIIEEHIAACPQFATSLSPLPLPEGSGKLDEMVAAMYRAGEAADVGPMAAVAGAVACRVGRIVRKKSSRVLVENGGDLYLDTDQSVLMGIYAGPSPFSGRIGLRFEPDPLPLAVCTSSATVGPSLSTGKADAATVVSRDAALADAVATALGNRVTGPEELEGALDWALSIPGIMGALAITGENIGLRGEMVLEKI